MDDTLPLHELGLTLPSPSYLFGAIMFGIMGFAAYRYGKRAQLLVPRCLGVALMLYPYLISTTWQLYLVGTALCVAVYVYRH